MDWWSNTGREAALDVANTAAGPGRPDLLTGDGGFREWRARAGAPDELNPDAVRAIRDVVVPILDAAALGRPLDDRVGGPLDAANRLAAAAPWFPQLRDGAICYVSFASPADAYAGEAAGSAIRIVGGERGRLRRCAAPGCTRFFVTGRAARHWCGDRCGARARVAAHRRRQTSRASTRS